MMIRVGRDNRDIMQCVQCSLNTVKAIQSELGENSDDNEAVAARKPHSQRRGCVRTDAFLADLQARVMENPGIGIRPLDAVVKPWITRVANGRPYVFQQDSITINT